VIIMFQLFRRRNSYGTYLWAYDLYGPVRNGFDAADPLRGQMGGGWALEIETFLGTVKWHQAVSAIWGPISLTALPPTHPSPLPHLYTSLHSGQCSNLNHKTY
jgi:hypothetical protein